MSPITVVNLSASGDLSLSERRTAARWMAQAFADAPAIPALTIFFAAAPYSSNRAMHEAFWASHLYTVAQKGILLGAMEGDEWRGFRCFFEPSQGAHKVTMSHYEYSKGAESQTSGPGEDEDPDWATFLELTGEDKYSARVKEWRRLTSETEGEIGIELGNFFTTSIIVVDPAHQRRGIGKMLDDKTTEVVRQGGGRLFVRIHEYILPFYEFQGYKVLASPTYSLEGSDPFNVHFLLKEVV